MSSSSQAAASSSQSRKPSQQTKNSSSIQKQNKSDSTLVPLLRHFVGIDLIVETKQGRTFRGTLREADAYMNLVLSRNASQQSKNNNVNKSKLPSSEQSDLTDVTSNEQLLQFDLVHIRGPTIRYIVFGPSVDITGVVKAGRDRERAAGDKYRRGVRKAPRR